MKRSAIILFLVLFAADAFSQKTGWDKLQTDDGELTMLMPAGCYTSFYDRHGITAFDHYRQFQLTEMRLISCFRDGALLSVEIYENGLAKAAARVLREKFKIGGEELSIGKDFYAVAQVKEKTDHTLARRVVASDRRIYLITAAARQTANETMRTFLDSINFAGDDAAQKPDGKTVLISSLESRVPEVAAEKETTEKSSAAEPPKEDQMLKKMILLSIPVPSYTEAARKKRTTGRTALRLIFGAEGRVTRLQVVKDLPDGLLRETVIAALRIKFLPAELDGAPISVNQQIEYKFGIY
jgi:TonB family protein